MQTVEITNPVEARRCRIAQYRRRPAELSLNGSRFFGMVRAVQEDRSRTPPRWIVTIVPTAEKPPLVGWRYSTRGRHASLGGDASLMIQRRDRARSGGLRVGFDLGISSADCDLTCSIP